MESFYSHKLGVEHKIPKEGSTTVKLKLQVNSGYKCELIFHSWDKPLHKKTVGQKSKTWKYKSTSHK